jgi:hypothetical protein
MSSSQPHQSLLWVDKHRPSTLAKLTLHVEVNSKLLALAQSDELPHLLFFGPSGIHLSLAMVTFNFSSIVLV